MKENSPLRPPVARNYHDIASPSSDITFNLEK